MNKIIALSGWKKSGKDTAAKYLIKNFGVKRYAFADELKMMVSEMYDIPLEWCHDELKKEEVLLRYPVEAKDSFSKMIHEFMRNEFYETEDKQLYWTPRSLLILEGSVKRSVTSSFWVKRVMSRIEEENPEYAVITDMRYISEAQLLKGYFGDKVTMVRINRFISTDSTDPSERDLDGYKFNYLINNYKSNLNYLENSLDYIMKREGIGLYDRA